MQSQPNLWRKNQSQPPLLLADLEILRPDWDTSLDLVLQAQETTPSRIGWMYANCVNMVRRNPDYRKHLQNFEFLFNDGAGVEIAAKILGMPVSDNLCGTDWIPALLDHVNEMRPGTRVFLLGGKSEHTENARLAFQQRWPALVLADSHHGYFNDDQEILDLVRHARPDLLITGLGVPRQEFFLSQYWQELTDSGVRIAVAGGAIMDHLAGAITRAPRWLRKLRLEWLYRLVTEPRRLWRRYLIGNTVFFWDLLHEWRRHARKTD